MGRAFRLGLFIVSTLLILAAGVFLIGEKQLLFKKTYRLEADFRNVVGLDNGAEVRVGGIHLGTVKYISLPSDPKGKLTVMMDMDPATMNIIRQDSIATIKTEGLLGSKYVEISFGTEKSPEVENGDAIKGEIPVDFTEVALAAANQAKASASSFQEVADGMKQNFFLKGYFERRGYESASDLKKDSISKVPSQNAAKVFAYDAKDIFDKPDNAKLKHEKSFDEAGKFMEQDKFREVVIASTDDIGDSKKARTLTLARAKVVRDYLVKHYKFDDKKVKTIGLGKTAKEGEGSKVEIRIYH